MKTITDTGSVPLDLEFIKSRRIKLELTQDQCAKRARFPNLQSWSKLENGHMKDPQLSTLERIAKALDCKVSDLLA